MTQPGCAQIAVGRSLSRRRVLLLAAGASAGLLGLNMLPRMVDASPALVSVGLIQAPLYRQEHDLTCEAAALRMALGALGINVAESDLLAGLARDPTPRAVLPDATVQWGDPNLGFVGQWDGAFAVDGYGVYQDPIAALARASGAPQATPLFGAAPDDLYAAVANGSPVVAWIPYDGNVLGRGSWLTPAGQRIDYVVTEHAVVLVGVDAQGVTYADPYTASLKQMTYARFEASLAELQNRAVILGA